MKHDVVVVGGGIVGASTAWHLASRGRSVLVVDKEPSVALHQTGHNSGVLHSGVYYEPGGLKAELCRRGAAETKAFAREHGVPVVECGKLLVATDESEVSRLEALEARAAANGVRVERVDARGLRRREPNVSGLGALFVPGTAITDFVAITRALVGALEPLGSRHQTGTTVTGVEESGTSVVLTTSLGRIEADQVVFCAGLQADRMALLAGIEPHVRIVPFRGEYYDVVPEKRDLVSTLVYPVPDPALPFLGVHLTPTVRGELSVGPNAVLGLSREGYAKGSLRWADLRDLASFPGTWRVARGNVRTGARELRNSLWRRGYLRECQKYCPSLELDDLVPREAGIRAQAVRRDGSFVHDFLIRRTPRTLHVLNAPSPAATSALPIGDRLATMVGDQVA